MQTEFKQGDRVAILQNSMIPPMQWGLTGTAERIAMYDMLRVGVRLDETDNVRGYVAEVPAEALVKLAVTTDCEESITGNDAESSCANMELTLKGRLEDFAELIVMLTESQKHAISHKADKQASFDEIQSGISELIKAFSK